MAVRLTLPGMDGGGKNTKNGSGGLGMKRNTGGESVLTCRSSLSLLGSLTEEMLKHQEAEERWGHHTDELWTEARAVKARTRQGHRVQYGFRETTSSSMWWQTPVSSLGTALAT